MRNKEYLFLCSTKYTIFNAINMVLNNPDKYKKADIVVFHRTVDMKEVSRILDENKIFTNIYNFPYINKLNVIYLLLVFIFPRYLIPRLCLNNESSIFKKKHYDILISQNHLYASFFKRLSKDSEVYFIEDGLSSYTSRTVDPKQRSWYFTLANRLLFRGSLISDVKIQYLYWPSMYMGAFIDIKQLPVCKPKDLHIYNDIFKYETNKIYDNCKFVYLGSPYSGLLKLVSKDQCIGNDFETKAKYIVDSAIRTAKNKDFIYRKHPVENIDEDDYEKICKIDILENMWEVECGNSITSGQMIVSFFSTGMFTPKILYNQEPYLVFLYKILDVDFFNADKLVFELKKMYDNPSKVMAPESLGELRVIIEKHEHVKII